MRIEQLVYLVEVVDSGSMSKAAKNLFVTQPAVSNAISALEEEIGWPILERTVSGVKPTTKGKLVVDNARFIIHLVHNWSKEIDPKNLEKITGDIYIANSSELGLSFFQDTIMDLNRMYPKMVVHSVPLESHPLKEINNGRFQLTVLPIIPDHHQVIESYLSHYNWVLNTLYVADCTLLISSTSPLSSVDQITPEMLAGYEVAVYPNFPYRKLLEHKIPGIRICYEEPLHLVTFVANDDAIAIVSPSQDVLLQKFIENGIIYQRTIAGISMPMEINLIYLSDFQWTDAGQLIIKTIQDRYKRLSEY